MYKYKYMLLDFANIPIDTSVLKSYYSEYKSVNNKIAAMQKSKKLIRLKKGLFVVSPKLTGLLLSKELIANHLYGPSYVSCQTALAYYGLIQERVYTTISITSKYAKHFKNDVGEFSYYHCNDDYFSVAVNIEENNNVNFLIASPEKALCDLIVYSSNLNLRYKNEILEYLQNDIRLDLEAFYKFDVALLKQCALLSKKKTMITTIINIIENEYYI